MRHLFLTIFAAVLMVGCCNESGYTLTGKLSQNDGYVVLNYKLNNEPHTDTCALNKGAFIFKGDIPEATYATLFFVPKDGEELRGRIYLENAKINVVPNYDRIADYTRYKEGKHVALEITGGANNELQKKNEQTQKDIIAKYPDAMNARKEIEDMQRKGDTKSEEYKEKYKAFQSNYGEIMRQMAQEANDATMTLIKENPDVELSAILLGRYAADMDIADLESYFNAFTPKVQNSELARRVRNILEAKKKTAPGAEAPDFTLKDLQGNDFSLSSLRGHYVIIDFWASWCKPCRASIPGLIEIYNKYHAKGLEILGVSDDSRESDWRTAVEEDKSPWIHTIDEFPVKNEPARVGTMYDVHYIPCLYLIDPDGKIVAGKISHHDLEKKLIEIYGE